MKTRSGSKGRRAREPRARALWLATAALPVLLTIGGCERADDGGTANGETEAAARFADVGPDWAIVQEYLDWKEAPSEGEEPAETPDINRAAAAARAIVETNGEHEKTIDAAEFLANLIRHNPMTLNEPETDGHVVAGARALAAHAADYGDWPRTLSQMNRFKRFDSDGTSSRPETDAFLDEMASEAENPVLRAASRYYLAAALVDAANVFDVSPEDRAARRARALELASGLSAAVEHEVFSESASDGATETYAEAEASLIRMIRHATIGGTLPALTGVRLDGAEDHLAVYEGRVLLVDFWATWCKPCVAALPQLRELVADSPSDRFALLSISVDKELETVTDFQEDEPMPWPNWHDPNGEVVDALAVRSFPTYVLADEKGEILARTKSLSDEFMSLLDYAVEAKTAD